MRSIARVKLWFPCLLLAGTMLFAGCGDSGSDDSGQTMADRQAAAQKIRMEKLQAKIKAQKKQLEIEQQTAAAKAKKVAAASDSAGNLDSYLATLPGKAGLVVSAPGGDGPKITGGDLTTGAAWSTIKVPISERVLDDFGGPAGISSDQAVEINRAITISDNDAAASLFSDLEKKHGGLNSASSAVGEMLQQAGDFQTEISSVGRDTFSTYGQTDWSLDNQNKYMAALAGDCLADKSTTDYLLDQMSMTGGEDTYGIGSVGVPAEWKGGWGPGVDGKYLVRQMGAMTVDGTEMVVSLGAEADDGTFNGGTAMATEIAIWAQQNLSDEVPDSQPCGPVDAPSP